MVVKNYYVEQLVEKAVLFHLVKLQKYRECYSMQVFALVSLSNFPN